MAKILSKFGEQQPVTLLYGRLKFKAVLVTFGLSFGYVVGLKNCCLAYVLSAVGVSDDNSL